MTFDTRATANSASETVQSIAKKPRVKRAVSAKIDTGTDGKAGARFRRIKAGVMAKKIKPSIRGIQSVEGRLTQTKFGRRLNDWGFISKKQGGAVFRHVMTLEKAKEAVESVESITIG